MFVVFEFGCYFRESFRSFRMSSFNAHIERAKLAEQAERYDDMANAMKAYVSEKEVGGNTVASRSARARVYAKLNEQVCASSHYGQYARFLKRFVKLSKRGE